MWKRADQTGQSANQTALHLSVQPGRGGSAVPRGIGRIGPRRPVRSCSGDVLNRHHPLRRYRSNYSTLSSKRVSDFASFVLGMSFRSFFFSFFFFLSPVKITMGSNPRHKGKVDIMLATIDPARNR